MTINQEVVLAIIFAGLVFGAAFGWFKGSALAPRDDALNRNLRNQLEEDRRKFERRIAQDLEALDAMVLERTDDCDRQIAERQRALAERQKYVEKLRQEFNTGFLSGRRWLAKFVSEADRIVDESISNRLRSKNHPALKAADEVAEARAERRLFKERAKYLEYQILSFKEYFPFLEDYENIILDEAVPLARGGPNLEELEQSDPVLQFVTKEEYERLGPAERNQRALDRFLSKTLSQAAIGRLYEQYIGYLCETDGWQVEYHGILKGFEDLGRDLICTRGNQVMIVQAKCWSNEKLIHEKHVFQLFGTTQLYLINRPNDGLFKPEVSASLVTTTSLSSVARKAAEHLKIEVKERLILNKKFPMIKCNVNQATGAKIYHLPFDQQYDRTKIVKQGERYVATVAEAEALGFRRAYRHLGPYA